jgi:hypothetical protein
MPLGLLACVQKSMKWFKKLFLHILAMALLNSFSLYLVSSGKYPSLEEFQLQINHYWKSIFHPECLQHKEQCQLD